MDISKIELQRQAIASRIDSLQRRDWCGKTRQGACLHTPENLAPSKACNLTRTARHPSKR